METENIKIGKWDILAVYSYNENLKRGQSDEEAKTNAVITCICGYKNRIKAHNPNIRGGYSKKLDKAKSENRVNSEEYSKVEKHLGQFYTDFKEKMYDLSKKYDYAEIKKKIEIPNKIGAKITLKEFFEKTK